MSIQSMRFDLEWAVRYFDSLEQYIKGEQTYMVKGTVQKIRETFETYGRNGKEGLFESLIFIENNPTSAESLKLTQQLKQEIQSAIKSL